ARGARLFDRPPRLVGVVAAAEEAQLFGVERLDAERQRPDAESEEREEPLGRRVFRVRFEEDPGAARDRERERKRREDLAQLVRLERGGGAAAEVDRVEWLGRLGRLPGAPPERDLGNQARDEPAAALRVSGQDREVAVGADLRAERDVEVEARGGP